MKKRYEQPQLAEYGSMNQLTLGPAGDIPDDPPDTAIGPNCEQQFPGQTDCHVEVS